MLRIILTWLALLSPLAAAADHHQRPSGYAVGLEIIDAWYGSEQRSCDATYTLGHCDGRAQCEVHASNRLCGDPDRGVRKQLSVRFSCGGGVETVYLREGQSTVLSCNNRRVQNFGRGSGRSGGIEILRADYGAGQRYCDAGYAFAELCNGRNDCRVRVDNKLCGDPFRGKRKSVQIEYRCGSRVYHEQAPENASAHLQCR